MEKPPHVVREVSFSISRTINLGDYENVKPWAHAKVELTDPADPATAEGRALIASAFTSAQDACFEQLVAFRQDWDKAMKG